MGRGDRRPEAGIPRRGARPGEFKAALAEVRNELRNADAARPVEVEIASRLARIDVPTWRSTASRAPISAWYRIDRFADRHCSI
jgi:hypothetical protein